MFFPVHAAVGAAIDKACGGSRKRKLLIVAPLALASHYFMDFFNCGYYTLFHAPIEGVGLTALVLFCIFLFTMLLITARKYWLGMLFGALPDVEHLFTDAPIHHTWPQLFTTEWGMVVQLLLFGSLVMLLMRHQNDRERSVDPSNHTND